MVFGFRTSSPDSYPERSSGSTFLRILLGVIHFILIVFGVAVAALYGTDVHRGASKHVPADGRWVFAVVVGILTVVSNIAYLVPIGLWKYFWPWDFILFFLWVVLTGIFGSMYSKEDPEGDAGVTRMKNSVYVDAVALIFAFFVAVLHLTLWIRHRQRRSLWTGRAPA